MKPEDAKKIKCDRCDAVVSLHRHCTGWRCPSCIWSERENLIEWAKSLLSATDYVTAADTDRQAIVVSRRSMDALAEVVQEVTTVRPLSIDSDAPVL